MQTMEKQIQSLTLQDRCDRCKAQAFVAAKGFERELLFCGHHYAKHEKAISKWAYEIIDEREFINKKSESST